MGDALSIFTDGWFQTDGEVPNIVEIASGGLWDALEEVVITVTNAVRVVVYRAVTRARGR